MGSIVEKSTPCIMCGKIIESKSKGNGFELLLLRWFPTLEPAEGVAILCEQDFDKIANILNLSEPVIERIKRQKPVI